MHLWRLDADPLRQALHAAEAHALGLPPPLLPGLYLCESPPPPGRASCGLDGGELLQRGAPEDLRPPPHATLHVVKGPFKVSGNPRDLLDRIPVPLRLGPRRTPLQLYCAPEEWFLVRSAPEVPFQAPLLPRRASTSLASQLGRALVNLVARPGESVLDPVCGTGVALVEAARLGCEVLGSDLSWNAVLATRENLASQSLSGSIRRADALALAGHQADALVADLPYGRRLETFDLRPFAAHLPTLARRWALVAHEDLRPALTEAGHPPHTTLEVPKPTFVRYVFLGGEPLPA